MHELSILMICAIIISLLQNIHTSPTVQINSSQIIGRLINFSGHGVNQYLGIPYAQPPVGQLRFQKPLPFQNYTPTFQANTNPPGCLQYATLPSFPWYIEPSKTSEDCLYLNIWTPAEASISNKKAVLFWIHGGGFRAGSMRSELHSGIPLASMGDIIVVTVDYRLGPFGFFTSGTEDAPINIGLWDILEGLKWVNHNIAAFGGDVHRITIAGQSAGAMTSGFFSVSPLTKGLFTRMIMQSGSASTGLLAVGADNIILGQRLANEVGCANDTYPIAVHPKEVVQCLRGVDADTLSKAEFELNVHSSFNFLPHWGDDFLPEDPRIAVDKGNFRCKDLLIGDNKDELAFLLTTGDPKLYGFFGKKNPRINKTLARETVKKVFSRIPGSQSIVDYYLPDNLAEHLHNKIRYQAYTSGGDFIIRGSDVYYAEKCAEQNRNVYYYLFRHRPSVTLWAEWMGVAHFDEVQFVFGQPILHPQKYQPSEVSLSQQMIDIWSHFVKHGKPSIPWPLYSRENPSFKYLGSNNTTEKNGVGPHFENCNFLRTYF